MKALDQVSIRLTLGIIVSLGANALAQPQFTDVMVLPGGAVQMQWASDPTAVYRIDYTYDLSEGIGWSTLYEDYPSQGTATFWADAGNLYAQPPISHPRDTAARFYRVVQTDSNVLADAPQVSMTSPTGGAVLTGDAMVSVSVASALGVDIIRLYVDGAEVAYAGAGGTNFTINTCQFANGPHVIFAVAASSSGGETTDEANDIAIGYGISPLTRVSFANLITDYRETFRVQDTAYGETNTFSADFATNVGWSLTITNTSGQEVRTITGTGTRMVVIWNGTDDSGATLPAAGYGAVLSATQAASPPKVVSPPGGGPPSPQAIGATSNGSAAGQAEGDAAGSMAIFPPLPPVLVDGVWLPWEDVFGPVPILPVAPTVLDEAQASGTPRGPLGFAPQDSPQSDPPSTQTTALEPLPSVWFGTIGTVGVAYQGNHPSVRWPPQMAPPNGLFGYVTLNTGYPAGAYGPLKTPHTIANAFGTFMQDVGYRLALLNGDSGVNPLDLRGPYYGGNGIFDDVNLGLLIGHGVYGRSPDYNISEDGPLQSYYPVYTGAAGYDWVGLSEFDFGSSSPNLRWMSILSCNNLVDSVYQDCWDKEVLPVSDTLHLLCGANSSVFMVQTFGIFYYAALTGGGGKPRQTVINAWFYAGANTQGRQPGGPHATVILRVIGWPNCFGDDLVNYQDPDSGDPADITYQDETVFAP